MAQYRIDVPDSALEKLRSKLNTTTFPDELDSVEQWWYGAPLKDVKRLTEAWKTFDWRRAEVRLNEIPQYMTSIQPEGYDPIDIHYVYVPSPEKDAIPLLFCHGCMFREAHSMYRALLLTTSRAWVIHRGHQAAPVAHIWR
jgi:hypothetical protein